MPRPWPLPAACAADAPALASPQSPSNAIRPRLHHSLLGQVAVTGGNFRDFEGTVVKAAGGRVAAELDIFGRKTRVELSPGDLAPADGASDA